ncbi:MAG: TIGR02452 family protein [Lachnospiraceae bacterium]|nr:TIGR02452 family protein [Lachnospiraceae bacterium]
MDRKAVAKQTVAIMEHGFYEVDGEKIDIKRDMEKSVHESVLITPEQGESILKKYAGACGNGKEQGGFSLQERIDNISTVDAVRILAEEGKKDIAVLNFASAKNPGGGFLNGAKAQEESITASSTLYKTLIAHPEYYENNRAQKSMMYTDHGIYSPDVLFIRNGKFDLEKEPVKASVLTIPAVNMGQVRLKGEDEETARHVMYRRMRLILSVFAEKGAKNLVLGAYGCGVFRNDPVQIALWWKELLAGGLGAYFESIFHAVLDHSKNQDCIMAFRQAAE